MPATMLLPISHACWSAWIARSLSFCSRSMANRLAAASASSSRVRTVVTNSPHSRCAVVSIVSRATAMLTRTRSAAEETISLMRSHTLDAVSRMVSHAPRQLPEMTCRPKEMMPVMRSKAMPTMLEMMSQVALKARVISSLCAEMCRATANRPSAMVPTMKATTGPTRAHTASQAAANCGMTTCAHSTIRITAGPRPSMM